MNHVRRQQFVDHLAVIIPSAVIVASTHNGIYVDGFIDVNLDPMQSLKTLMHAWNPLGYPFGTDSGFWQSNIFVTAIYAFLMSVCRLELPVAERVWLFVLVAVCGYGIQYLLRRILPDLRMALIVAPSFYVVNIPFLTSLKEGSTYALTSYAVLPLEIGLIVVAARGGPLASCMLGLGLASALFASSKILMPFNTLSGWLCSNPWTAISICCSSACHSIAFLVQSSSEILLSSLSV